MDANVAAEGGQRPVPGLVGDCSVGGAAEVSVSYKSGPQAVGAVPGWVEAGAGDGLLDRSLTRFPGHLF